VSFGVSEIEAASTHMGGSPTTLGLPGMHVKPLLPSRRITLLPCASVSMIRADSEMLSGPADIARAIFSLIVSPAFADVSFCEVCDSARLTTLTPTIRRRAMAVMALARNLGLELSGLMSVLLNALWQISLLARLRKHHAFEFAFGLEPIVQLSAWLSAAFEIDFVCATSDVLVTRRVPCRSLSRFRCPG
jgi:hypothetical protein